MNVPKTIPHEAFYLETGALNFETYIKIRRVIYYHSLANRNRRETIYAFFLAQLNQRKNKYEWVFQTQRDFEDFGIPYNIEYLENISKSTFKIEVKKRAQMSHSSEKYPFKDEEA